MAFNARKIPTVDFLLAQGVGVDLPFSYEQGVFRSNYTSREAIKNNIINYFLTEPGERPDNPLFGGGLRSFLFEQITSGTLDGIEDDISTKMSTYFPQVRVNSIGIFEITDSNIIQIVVKYSIPEQGILEEEFKINFG